ncbi:MAG: energy coupling factor transporter S component ThiW [Armatimonadota bacterium]|jgi:energy coupling factor transporter S component ThiW|nr:energy coupling factor transporter S component ThiW [Armatimonadota bacterium]MDR7448369.1 energy coupling factor transporter S component ThiW [Armatimonadota bacterium]MDR7459770.1 energy coupling factor transporter S component ThiW [Armatimonadota bacterium]MDR7479267.1 energy coupling factor transporter S component ThiW [Armatimonadota bacterium]MDR7489044.1 energy coupling factor transporter S component ThiW [Armatimonadota bacterium]
MQARPLVLAALFAALPVVLSFFPGAIPVAGAKVLPWQHMVNVVAGITLGPWYAALAATVAAIVRNALGVGTPLAFPGGMAGALVVGFAYRLWRRPWVGLLEPLGTGPVGATVGALIVAPAFMGKALPLGALMVAFLASSIPGAAVGTLLLKALERAGVTAPTGARG